MTQAYQDVARPTAGPRRGHGRPAAELEASLREKLNALPEDGESASEAERDSLSEQLAELETTAGEIQADAAVYGAGIDRIAQASLR